MAHGPAGFLAVPKGSGPMLPCGTPARDKAGKDFTARCDTAGCDCRSPNLVVNNPPDVLQRRVWGVWGGGRAVRTQHQGRQEQNKMQLTLQKTTPH